MSDKREPWNPLLKSYPDSRKINAVSLGAETMFTRLIARCDDHSNYDGDPKLLLTGLFGRRFANKSASFCKCKRWRGELVAVKLVQLYEVDGDEYLHIIKCKKALRADIKQDIRFPDVTDSVRKRTESVPKTNRPRNEFGPSTQNKQDSTQTNVVVTGNGKTDSPSKPLVCSVFKDRLTKALQMTEGSTDRGAAVLTAAGMHLTAAGAMADRYPRLRIRACCRYALRRNARNLAGMIRAALEGGWDLRLKRKEADHG